MRQGILILTFLLFFLLCKERVQKDENEFSNYRKPYHVKTLTLEKNHPLYSSFGGIHHIYANEKAFQGYKNKTKFPEGSLIVFDLLEVQKTENTTGEGKRKILAYMKKTSSNPETGNREFKAFSDGDLQKQIVNDPKSQCFTCHIDAEKNDYVFSYWRE